MARRNLMSDLVDPTDTPRVVIAAWPRRMPANLAALYCGEPSVRSFMSRVGKEYPFPRVSEGRRKLWLKDDLDKAIVPDTGIDFRDVADDL